MKLLINGTAELLMVVDAGMLTISEDDLWKDLKDLVQTEKEEVMIPFEAKIDEKGSFGLGSGMASDYIGAFTYQESQFIQSMFQQKNKEITKNTLFMLHDKFGALVNKRDVHLFSGSSELGSFRIDISKEAKATHLVTVQNFLDFCIKNKIKFDFIILDPPYNARYDRDYGTAEINHISDDNKFLAWLVIQCLKIVNPNGIIISKNFRSIRPANSVFITGMVSLYGAFRRATIIEAWEYSPTTNPFNFSWKLHDETWKRINFKRKDLIEKVEAGQYTHDDLKFLSKLAIDDANNYSKRKMTRLFHRVLVQREAEGKKSSLERWIDQIIKKKMTEKNLDWLNSTARNIKEEKDLIDEYIEPMKKVQWFLGKFQSWSSKEMEIIEKSASEPVLLISDSKSNPFSFDVLISTPRTLIDEHSVTVKEPGAEMVSNLSLPNEPKFNCVILDSCAKVGGDTRMTGKLKELIPSILNDGGFAVIKTYFDPVMTESPSMNLLFRNVITYDDYEKINLLHVYQKVVSP